jgi:hypothetical protein
VPAALLDEDLAVTVTVMDACTGSPGPLAWLSLTGPVADRGGAAIAQDGARSVNHG